MSNTLIEMSTHSYLLIPFVIFSPTVEDLERNDGSLQKPYFMSKNLMKILNKSNKAPRRGNAKD